MVNERDMVPRVLDVIRVAGRPLTISAISRQAGLDRHTVSHILEILSLRGQIQFLHQGMAKKYYLKESRSHPFFPVASADLIIIVDQALNLLYVNETAAGYIKIPANKLPGKKLESVFHPVFHHPEFFVHLQEASSQKVVHVTLTISMEEGSRAYPVTITPIGIPDKGPGIIIIIEEPFAGDGALASLDRELIVQLSPGIVVANVQGEILHANPSFLLSTGYPDELGIQGHPITNIIGEDRYFIDTILHLGTNHAHFHEMMVKRRDGSRVFCLMHWELVKSPSGVPLYISGTLLDMSGRGELKEKIATLEERFRNIVEGISDVIWETGNDFCYTYISPAITPMTGYQPGELIGNTPLWMAYEGKEEEIKRIFLDSLLTHSFIFIREHSLEHKDGHRVIVETRAIPLLLPTGELKGYRGIDRDITERKRVEEVLRESEEKLALVMNNVPVLLCYIDADLRYVYVNKAYADWYCLTREEIIGKKISDLLDEEVFKLQLPKYQDVLRGIPESFEILTHDGLGKERFVSVRFIPHHITGRVAGFFASILDVTGHKQAEEALYLKNFAIESSLNGIAIADLSGYLIYVNPAFLSIWGYDEPADVLRQSVVSFWMIPEEAIEVVDAIKVHGVWTGEMAGLRKDGNPIQVQLSANIIRDASGLPVAMMAAFIDITKRKRAEEALRESEEKHRFLIDESSDPIFSLTPNGTYTYVNRALAQVFGKPVEEIVGRDIWDFLSEEEADKRFATLSRVVQTGQQMVIEGSVPNADGDRYYITTIAPVKDGKGSVISAICTSKDITERRRMEEVLRESEKKYRMLADNAQDMIYRMSLPEGKYEYISPAAEQLTGYTPEEHYSHPVLTKKLIHPDWQDYFDKEWEALLKGDMPPFYEYQVIDRAGRTRWFFQRNILVKDDRGQPVAIEGIVTDITRRKDAEENILAAFKRTQDQQAALGLISFSPLLFAGDVHGLSAKLTEISSGVLDVERASVWLFNRKGDELHCIDLYEALYDRHSYDAILERYEYVNEFDALDKAKYIDAHDPLTDPRTAGYVETYIKPNRISSMLETVIRVSGQNLGVISFECVGRSHHWENDEITFACQLADQVAITLLNRDRNRADDALRLSNVFLDSIIDNIPDLIFLKDARELRFVRINRAVEELTGYSRADLLGKNDYDFVPDEQADFFVSKDRQVLREKKIVNIPEEPLQTCGKGVRTLHTRKVPLLGMKGEPEYLLGISEDITDRKRTDESLQKANRKLNLLSRITRHDISNQMTVLMGYLAILEKEGPDQTSREYFGKVITAAEQVLAMIRFTKEYEEIGVQAPAWQDCRTLVETAVQQATLGKVMVKNNLPAGMEVFADPLIVKVFINLIDNAVRYGGKIAIICFSALERDGDEIIVCEDDGAGVPAEEKEQIFLQGFGKNTGFGLALSREILDITGISIHETGKPGECARFEISVPKGASRSVGSDQ